MQNKEITFLLQGAFDKKLTPQSVNSIKREFPGASIILSTWQGTDVSSDLILDRCLFSPDPGGYADTHVNFVNNLCRQLVSTKRGLEEVKTKYVVKMRTDLAFFSDSLKKTFESFQDRSLEEVVFSKKIVIPSFFTKRFITSGDGKIIQPVPFHFSDWLCFGTTDDIFKLFECELPTEPENSQYFSKKNHFTNKLNLMSASHRFAPEQFIFYDAYKRLHVSPEFFENYLDYSDSIIKASDLFLVNNFIVYPPKVLGFYCLKEGKGGDTYCDWTLARKKIPYFLWDGLVRPYVYEYLYSMYCDRNYRISFRTKLQEYYERIVIGRLRKCHFL